MLEEIRDRTKWTPVLFKKIEAIHDTDEWENLKSALEREDKQLISEFYQAFAQYVEDVTNSEYALVSAADIEERTPEFLIPDYVPKGTITLIAGDGGVGKSSVWCAIAAAISNGKPPFLLSESEFPAEFWKAEPQKIFVFSGEDSMEYVLKERLRKNGAVQENIFTIPISNSRYKDIKFDSDYLLKLVELHRPTLVIFDPIQSFVPGNGFHMGDRNAMRQVMQPMIGMGEKFGTTFIVVCHTNKRSGVFGRQRLADSADIWDIARSVLMIGRTSEKGILYLSNEKSNYGKLAETVLFSLEDLRPIFRGYTPKRDEDFVFENDSKRAAPAKDEAIAYIRDTLRTKGQIPTKELEEVAAAQGISKSALRRGKDELKAAGELRYSKNSEGYWQVSLPDVLKDK